MGYSSDVLLRAREELDRKRIKNHEANSVYKREMFEAIPRLREIEFGLRRTMAKLSSVALSPNSGQGIKVIREENLSLQKEREALIKKYKLDSSKLNDEPICRHCGDRGYFGSTMCSCLQEICRREQSKELTKLVIFGNECFENFKLDYYPDLPIATFVSRKESDDKPIDPLFTKVTSRSLMKKKLATCKEYARTFTERGASNLFFSGASGLGKTYLSACIARKVADAGFSVIYETAQKIFKDYELEKFAIAQIENHNLTDRYKDCDLLIIDDLGTELTTQFTVTALYDAINSRIVERKATIISTNISPEMIEVVYSPQIASRINGLFQVVVFIGEDIRKVKQQEEMLIREIKKAAKEEK